MTHQQQLRVSENNGQWIIQFMRNTGDDLSHERHLFRCQ